MKKVEFEGYVFEENGPNLDKCVREDLNLDCCFYHKNSKKKEMECYCPTTGRTFTQSYEESDCCCSKGYKEQNFICKNELDCLYCNCRFYNAKYSLNNVKRQYDVGFFQKTNKGIVFRAFRVTYTFGAERVEGQGLSEDDHCGYPLIRIGDCDIEETERIFYNYDRTVEVFNKYVSVYNPYTGYKIGVRATWSKIKYPYNIRLYYVGNFYEDLKSLLFKSFYDYMIDFEKRLCEIDSLDLFPEVFLFALLKYPLLQVIKYGFYEIAREIYEACGRGSISLVKGINYRGKKIEKVLGFSLSKIPHCLCEDITCDCVDRVKFAIEKGLKINRKNYKLVKDFYFKDLFKYVDISEISQVCRYLLNQRKRYNAVWVSEYLFYLEYSKKFGFDLNNKELLYPVNLSSAHDNMVALVNKYNADSLLKGFYKAVIPYCKIKLSYKDYYISPVLTPMSLRRYADKFHNCSYGCCNGICEGKSVVFVVKSKLEPLIPYYMFSYSPKLKSLLELRAVKNLEAPKDIEDYVRRYVELLNNTKVWYATT
ncbi:MAG: PcfJ domain-containing protein [Clostridia bacterium]|nr:PcfJ domain-containing protein [Clostridia bacterium]